MTIQTLEIVCRNTSNRWVIDMYIPCLAKIREIYCTPPQHNNHHHSHRFHDPQICRNLNKVSQETLVYIMADCSYVAKTCLHLWYTYPQWTILHTQQQPGIIFQILQQHYMYDYLRNLRTSSKKVVLFSLLFSCNLFLGTWFMTWSTCVEL